MDFLFPMFMLGIFILVFVANHKVTKRRQEEWRRVAEELGLNCDGHQIHGQLASGREVRIWTERRGSQKNKKTYTCGTIRIPSLPTTLNLTREGFMHKAGKLLGMQDHQVGDDQFDRLFMVRGDAKDIEEPLHNKAFRNAIMINWTEQLMSLSGQHIRIDRYGHLEGNELHNLIHKLDTIGAQVEDTLITEVW